MIGLRKFILLCFQHALVLVLICSCSKVEEPYPEVSFTYIEGGDYKYGDTIRLGFESTNNDSYTLSLLQGNTVITLPQREVFKEGNQVDLELVLNDRYLASGAYDLRLQVKNKDKGASTFSTIQYTGLLAAQLGFALLGQQDVELIDTNQNRISFPLSASFDHIKVSSRDSLVYLVAFANEGAEVRRLGDFELIRKLPLVAPTGSRSYHQFVKSEQGLFLLRTDGGIDFLEEGSLQAATALPIGRAARQGCILNSKLVAVTYDQAGLNAQMEFFNSDLNGSFQSYPLPGANHVIFPLHGNTGLAVLLRRNSNWELHFYNTLSQSLSLEYIGNDQIPLAGSATAQSQLIMFSTDQDLYRVFIGGSSVPMTIQGGLHQQFALSTTDQGLYLQKAKTVYRLNLDNNLQFAASKFDVLQDYDILYNK